MKNITEIERKIISAQKEMTELDERKQAAARPFTHKVIVRKTGFKIDSDIDPEDLPIHELYAALTND